VTPGHGRDTSKREKRMHKTLTGGVVVLASVGLIVAMGVTAGASAGNAKSASKTYERVLSTAQRDVQRTANSKLSVGFVVGLASDPYFVTMKVGAVAEAKKLGVTLYYEGSTTTYSPASEEPYVTAVLAKHPSAFVLSATSVSACVPMVEEAVKLNIPTLTVDSTISKTSLLKSRIAGDNTGGGVLAAQLIAKSVGASGQVLLMEGIAGVTPDILRANAFIATLKKDYPKIDFVGTQFSDDVPTTAETIVSAELARFPNLKGIFAIDDTTAEGVVAELTALGKLSKIKVIAYDAEPTEVAAVESGKLVGLIAQQPALEGQLAVEYAVDTAEGKTVPTVVQVPNVTITHANYRSLKRYFYKA
jgi:ribose transport system substrate-binding protein